MMKGQKELVWKQYVSSRSVAAVVFSALGTLLRAFNWPVKLIACSFGFDREAKHPARKTGGKAQGIGTALFAWAVGEPC